MPGTLIKYGIKHLWKSFLFWFNNYSVGCRWQKYYVVIFCYWCWILDILSWIEEKTVSAVINNPCWAFVLLWDSTCWLAAHQEYGLVGYRLKLLLTHLPLGKMAAIMAYDNFKCIFLNENDRIFIRISLKFVLRSPIDNKTALVQVMAWRQAIICIKADPVHWQIYTALGGDELTHWGPRQNGRRFTDDIFKCIFLTENVLIFY